MQIVSENILLNNIENVCTEYIEGELKKRNLDVIRWAIVDSDENYFTVCVSHVIIS